MHSVAMNSKLVFHEVCVDEDTREWCSVGVFLDSTVQDILDEIQHRYRIDINNKTIASIDAVDVPVSI